MTKSLIPFFLLLAFFSCSPGNDPQKIIDRSIETAGGERFEHSEISFDFRDRHYIARRNKGEFVYSRITQDSTQTILDVLDNQGFQRKINGNPTSLPDSMKAKYSRSVNSVIYFALLPYGLNDPAVRKKLLGHTVLKGEPYYKIEITFQQEGGGKDFQDIFHYWIHENRFTVDYFAYLYYTDEGGIRFRKAIKSNLVNGILIQDYLNYKPLHDKADPALFNQLETLYGQDSLVELSRIELKNISVKEVE